MFNTELNNYISNREDEQDVRSTYDKENAFPAIFVRAYHGDESKEEHPNSYYIKNARNGKYWGWKGKGGDTHFLYAAYDDLEDAMPVLIEPLNKE